MTAQDYLDWEHRQDIRHEYYDGEVYAMTGASREHNLLSGNTFSALHGQLRGRNREVYNNDMRVKVSETGMYTYPDIVAACGRSEFEDAEFDTLLNPALIVEVLSDSTERYDRGAKFGHYRNLSSLQDYLLVSQAECRVEHYRRQDASHWLLSEYRGMQDMVELDALGCRLLLADMYERVLMRP